MHKTLGGLGGQRICETGCRKTVALDAGSAPEESLSTLDLGTFLGGFYFRATRKPRQAETPGGDGVR